MLIKKYIVKDMNEAITKIRCEIGKDAVIVSQRRVKKPGISGFFSKKLLEVTVAVNKTQSDSKNKEYSNELLNLENKINEASKDRQMEILKEVIKKSAERTNLANQEYENKIKDKNNEKELKEKFLDEVKELKEMIKKMDNKSETKLVKEKDSFELELEDKDICRDLISEIMEKYNLLHNDEYTLEEKKKKSVCDFINISEPNLEGPVVLVGPTGVGKTTTIAKLAGKLALIEKKKVGLITIDTYRIGAVEQLKTYANIMHIPFKVILTLEEIDSELENMKDCDVILIDTTGRSSNNLMQLSELRSFIEKVNTENIYLVQSCTTKNKDIKHICKSFEILNYKKIIITKLDETTSYGGILNIMHYSKKPLSFITVGQNVPDDIKQCSKEEICKLILGEDSLC